VAAVVWQVLLSVGTLLVGEGLMGAGQVYGRFGIVLGLLAWIYLEALIVVLAAELNVVLTERLWPRSLLTPFIEDVELTGADRRSYAWYANAQRYKDSERITVEFEQRPVADRERQGPTGRPSVRPGSAVGASGEVERLQATTDTTPPSSRGPRNRSSMLLPQVNPQVNAMGRTSWPVSRILFPGASRRSVRRPSI
jgi:hypothetical protein